MLVFQIENPQFDKEFLIALACLKNDDPRIYDKDVNFFSDTVKSGTSEGAEEKKTEKKKEKAISIRDYERNIILERNGRYSSSEDEDDTKQSTKIKIPTYIEEQKELKDSFKTALQDDDEDDDLLTIKQKTDDEKQKVLFSYLKKFFCHLLCVICKSYYNICCYFIYLGRGIVQGVVERSRSTDRSSRAGGA